jgi:hypothetical protein
MPLTPPENVGEVAVPRNTTTRNPTRSSMRSQNVLTEGRVDGIHQELRVVHFFPDSTTVEEVKISDLRHDRQLRLPHSVIDAVEDGCESSRS